jgi:outer membrane receptor protein involved in Fe transport
MVRANTTIVPFCVMMFLVAQTNIAHAQTAPPTPAPAPATTTPAPALAPTNTTPVETVVVTARPNSQQTKIDRTTYDVRTNPEAPVSPAIDVIAKLPGIFVGPNNRISMAGGAYVTVLVDGRPMLRDAAMQIPAERIASIEVISNPSAEFASSSEAIINIVLKKTSAAAKASGSVGISIDSFENTGLNASLDRRLGKWGLSLSARLADRSSIYKSSGEFSYLGALPNDVSRVVNSGGSLTTTKQGSGFARLTRDFSEFEDIELSVSLFRQTGGYRSSSLETANVGNALRLIDDATQGTFEIDSIYAGATFTSEHEKDYKFETSLSFNQNGFSKDDQTLRSNRFYSQDESSDEESGSIDAKFEKHFTKDRLLTTGAELSSTDYMRSIDDLGYLSPLARQSDLFAVRQRDFSAYATYQFKLGAFGFLPGIRFERSDVDWSSTLAARTGENSYDRILPSLFITHKLGGNGKLRASYSEGTTQLSIDQLNPSLRYQGQNYAVQGNPLLEPADRRTFELGYDYDKGDLSLVSTFFYRDTTNQTVGYSRRGAGELLIANYVNLGQTLAYGAGATLKGKLDPKLSYTLDFEVSSNSFTNPFLSAGQTDSDEIAYNGKFILDYKPNSVDQFSATTTFQSDVISLNEVRSGFWTTNFQFSHKFANKVSLVINAINVGVSPVRSTRSTGIGFESRSQYEEGTRALKIGLTKRF